MLACACAQLACWTRQAVLNLLAHRSEHENLLVAAESRHLYKFKGGSWSVAQQNMNCSGCNHIYKPLVNWILFWVTYRNSMICHLSIVHQNRPVVSYSIHSSSEPASKLWRPSRSKHARRRLVKWDTSMRSGWQGSHYNGQDLIKCKKEKFGDRSWSGITMIYTRVLRVTQ